jgi:NADH-quinone oxidoreductase subunit G
VNSSKRLNRILIRHGNDGFKPVSRKNVISKLSEVIQSGKAIGIGSARASLESNFALKALAGAENFYAGTSATESDLVSQIISILRNGRAKAATLNEVGLADAVLVLGEDVLNTAPMLGLALRQSILQKPLKAIRDIHIDKWSDTPIREALQQEKGPLYIASTHSTGMDDAATEIYHSAPADLARLGFAVANKLDNKAPAVGDLSEEMNLLAGRIAEALQNSERPLIIAGISLGSRAIIEAAANIVNALGINNANAKICFTAASCNSIGLGLLEAKPINKAIEAVAKGDVNTIIILENDIYRNIDTDTADKFLKSVENVIVIDSIENKTTEKAHIILPAATFAESSGTFVNNEGRAQRFFKCLLPTDGIHESWRWIGDIMLSCGMDKAEGWHNLDGIIKDIANDYEVFKPITEAAKLSDYKILGQKIPRQARSYSGRTAIFADIDVNEPQPPIDEDSPLSFSMEGFPGQPPASLISHYWAPNWNSVQSVNKYQKEVGGTIRGGDSGKRLLEPLGVSQNIYFTEIPNAFRIQDGQLLIVPSYHIFGSEELSSLSSSIAELVPKPYIAINPQDAVSRDGKMEIVLSNLSYLLPVKTDSSVPRGMALIPAGLEEMPWDGVPVWVKINK